MASWRNWRTGRNLQTRSDRGGVGVILVEIESGGGTRGCPFDFDRIVTLIVGHVCACGETEIREVTAGAEIVRRIGLVLWPGDLSKKLEEF